jgi:WD40 repeat protein
MLNGYMALIRSTSLTRFYVKISLRGICVLSVNEVAETWKVPSEPAKWLLKFRKLPERTTPKQLTLIGHDHDSVVNDAEFSPDGTSLLTASSDQTVRIWNAATGNQIAILRGHEDVVNSAAFSSDGKTIITASDDGTAKAWKIASNIDQLINLAKLSIPRCLSKEQRREYFLPEDIPDWCVGMNKWPSRNTRGQR